MQNKRVRNKRTVAWQEPDRSGDPEMSTEQVRQFLGYKSHESVRTLADKGPEHDGLAAYFYLQDEKGEWGWRRKKPEQTKNNMPRFFYREDVIAWKASHPIIEPIYEKGYSPEEEQMVLAEMENFRRVDGTIRRMELARHLEKKYGRSFSSGKPLLRLKAILDKHEGPLPERAPQRRRIV